MRTDRAWVCLDCLGRQPPSAACARCGGARLVDHRTPAGRSEATRVRGERAVARLVGSGDWRSRLFNREGGHETTPQQVVVGSLLSIAEILFCVFHPTWKALAGGEQGALLAALAWLTPFALVFATLAVVWVLFTRPATDGRPTPASMESVDGAQAEPLVGSFAAVSGRVRVRDAVVAPLSGEAVAAARLLGTASGGAVDDALCGAFDVIDAQGELVARVEPGVAAVSLDVAAATAGDEFAHEALWAFLATLGLCSQEGRFSLAEAALRDGDAVTVEGVAADDVTPDGYRGTRAVKVFRGTAERPTCVRRAEEPRVRVDASREDGASLGEADEVSVAGASTTRHAKP